MLVVMFQLVRLEKMAHKNQKRLVFLNETAQRILEPYLGADDEICFSPAKSVEIQRRKKSDARVVPLSCGSRPKR